MKTILASTSPRRKELLSQVGLQFECVSPSVNEDSLRGESPAKMVRRLAREKARAVLNLMGTGDVLIIAADTTVVSPAGKNLGKPADVAEAGRMLKSLVGKTHVVLTAYCLLQRKNGKEKIRVNLTRTRVKMRAMNAAMISDYVATGEPMDKAGAYAAQGIGMSLIESISGSYTGVVGLPVAQVLVDMEKYFGVKILK